MALAASTAPDVVPEPLDGVDKGTAGAAATFAATVGLSWGISTIALMGLGVFIQPLQREFGWPRAQVALVSTVINLAVVLMSPVQGMLVDRFGSRRVVLPSLAIFAVGLMLLYYLPSRIEIFYLSWAVLASLGVGLLPGSYLRVVGSWFNKRLGLALGMANAGIGLGNILVPLVAAAVIAASGWRMAYVTLGLVMLVVVFPVCFLWLRERGYGVSKSDAERTADGLAKADSFKLAVRSRPFWVLLAAFFFLGLVNTALVIQQVPLLLDAGFTPQKAALIQSMFGASLLIGRLVTGYLLDRVFAPVLIIVVAFGAAAACLMYAIGIPWGLVYLPAILLGLVIGAEFNVLGYTIKRYFGLPAFGKIYAVVFSIFQLAGALGAAAFALSRDASGNYKLGLYAAAGALVLASAAIACLPKYPEKT